LLLACWDKNEVIDNKSPFRNVYSNAHYVGSEACENCHAQQHSTFIHTGMGQSFDTASKEKSAANFDNAIVYDSSKNLYYRAFWDQGQMYIEEVRLNKSDTLHYRKEKVDYIIGSGHHTNSHFWKQNGYVYQAPMTYYVQEKKWGLPPGYESNNIGFTRKIAYECMSCHNSLPGIQPGSVNKYLDIPKGIGCERCHGPGSIHVKEKKEGIFVDTKNTADYSIVNPKRLPWKLQIDICQRCHLQGNAVLKEGKTFEDFRPGMRLSDIFQVFLPVYDNPNHPFVMASHAERFKMSKCFIESNSDSVNSYNPNLNFTCINCHNPHLSVRETNIANFNNTCKSCHVEGKKLIGCSEQEIELKKVNNNCVQCHMPTTGSEDIPHVSIHDHYIRKPKQYEVQKGNLIGLKSINGGDTSQLTLLKAYLTYFEKFDANPFYSLKADEYAKKVGVHKYSNTAIHYWYNKGQFAKVVTLSSSVDTAAVDNPFTAYQIGQSNYNELNYAVSVNWYNRAISLNPYNLNYRIAKVQVLLELRRTKEAKSEIDFVLSEQPKTVEALYLKGVLHLQEGNSIKARASFTAALELNPDFEKALKQLKGKVQ
jgi:tetratricopeptide (TPR) repeat protein